jgi:adenine phosphoribosyltransferase
VSLREAIRAVPDFPRPGIVFRDITTLLGDARAFAEAIDLLAAPFTAHGVETVVGIEARGFILGGAVAHLLGAGFAPARKAGKLPRRTLAQAYALEYGDGALEMHADALKPGARVLLIDDLIATGGTAEAALALIARLGGDAIGASFVIDLPALGGAQKLRARGLQVETLCAF